MSVCCLLWFGCMTVRRKKTVGIKVNRMTKTAVPGTPSPEPGEVGGCSGEGVYRHQQTCRWLTLWQDFRGHTHARLYNYQIFPNLVRRNLFLGLFEAKNFVIFFVSPFKVILQHNGEEQNFGVTQTRIQISALPLQFCCSDKISQMSLIDLEVPIQMLSSVLILRELALTFTQK